MIVPSLATILWGFESLAGGGEEEELLGDLVPFADGVATTKYKIKKNTYNIVSAYHPIPHSTELDPSSSAHS